MTLIYASGRPFPLSLWHIGPAHVAQTFKVNFVQPLQCHLYGYFVHHSCWRCSSPPLLALLLKERLGTGL